MNDLISTFTQVRSFMNSTTSEPDHQRSNTYTLSIIFTFGLFAIVLVAIIIISYHAFYKSIKNKRQKHIRQPIRSRNMSSVYVIPVNTTPTVIEESPPSYYSIVQSQERQSGSSTSTSNV